MKIRLIDQTRDIPVSIHIRNGIRSNYRSQRKIFRREIARRYAISFGMCLAWDMGYLGPTDRAKEVQREEELADVR